MTSSLGHRSEMAVNPRRSKIATAAMIVVPLPRVVTPFRICSPACGPT